METDEIFFEINDGNHGVKVIPQGFSYPNAQLVWDSNWLKAKVIIKAGAFSGIYQAEFMNIDFRAFKKELEYLYDHLDSTATFKGLESNLEISIDGDGLGHLEVLCKASDNPGYLATQLEFYLNIDQTYIPVLTRQLENIVKDFPIKDL